MDSNGIYNLAHVSSLSSSTDSKIYNNTFTITFHCSFAKILETNETYYRYDNLSVLHDVQSLCSISKKVGSLMWLSIILGIPGNVIALITILTMSQTTSTFYIALLSFSDLIALTSRASYTLFTKYRVHTKELCQFMSFLTNFSLAYANWVLVLICFERFITIQFPLKKTYIFTIRRARYSGLILALVIFPIGIMFNFLPKAYDGHCVPEERWEEFNSNGFSQVTTALFFFVPVLLLFLFTILVMRALKKHAKMHRSLMNNESNSKQHEKLTRLNQDQGGSHNPDQRLTMAGTGKTTETLKTGARSVKSSKNGRRDDADALGRSITIMMIINAIVYVVLTIPICVNYLYSQHNKISTNVSHAESILLGSVAFQLNLLSHSVNFYIYFVSAKKFRSQLHWLFVKRGISACLRQKQRVLSFNSRTIQV